MTIAGLFLSGVAFDLFGPKNTIEQSHTSILIRQQFVKWFAGQLFEWFTDRLAEGGICIAKNV